MARSRWIRIDGKDGTMEAVEMDRLTLMQRYHVRAVDLVDLDPHLDSPSKITARPNCKSVVINLLHIRAILTDHHLLVLDHHHSSPQLLLLSHHGHHITLQQYVAHALQARLMSTTSSSFTAISIASQWPPSAAAMATATAAAAFAPAPADAGLGCGGGGHGHGDSSRGAVFSGSDVVLPFELLALKVVLDAVCTYFGFQAIELQMEADDLATSKIKCTSNSAHTHFRHKLHDLISHVQEVKDEINRLMKNDDGYMYEMYLTKKKQKTELLCKDQALATTLFNSRNHVGGSISKLVSYVDTPKESSGNSRVSRGDSDHDVQQLEILLVDSFSDISLTLKKLFSLKDCIIAREDSINNLEKNVEKQYAQFERKHKRRRIKFDQFMLVTTFAIQMFTAVTGTFGMNFPIHLYQEPHAFMWVLVISGVLTLVIFCALWHFKSKMWVKKHIPQILQEHI